MLDMGRKRAREGGLLGGGVLHICRSRRALSRVLDVSVTYFAFCYGSCESLAAVAVEFGMSYDWTMFWGLRMEGCYFYSIVCQAFVTL